MRRVLRVGRYEIHEAGRQLLADGRPVPLGSRAFDLLVALADSPEQFLGKDDLMATVWPGVVVEENNITVQVSALRKALGADAIVTVPQRGYRLSLPVSQVGSLPPDLQARSLAAPQRPSVAVLPFANLSGRPDDEYFCDGISEDITTELARFHSLFVIARNSSFTYKGRAVDVRTIAAELGVRYLLEGSARRLGDRVRVTAQLIEAATGQHLWAEKYDRVLADIFDMQEEVTRAIVGAIAPQIEVGEQLRVGARPASMDAYEMALRARALMNLCAADPTPAGRHHAMQLAYDALAIDPSSALAIRTITNARVLDVYYGAEGAALDIEDVLRLATRAVAADASSHEARLRKGMILCMTGRPGEGLVDLRAARELNPNDAETAGWLGFYEALCGDPPTGIRLATDALRLSPRDPQRYLLFNLLAWPHFAGENYQEAIACARSTLGERPDFPASHLCLAVALAALGDLAGAHVEYRRTLELAPRLVEGRMQGRWLGSDSTYRARATRLLKAAAQGG